MEEEKEAKTKEDSKNKENNEIEEKILREILLKKRIKVVMKQRMKKMKEVDSQMSQAVIQETKEEDTQNKQAEVDVTKTIAEDTIDEVEGSKNKNLETDLEIYVENNNKHNSSTIMASPTTTPLLIFCNFLLLLLLPLSSSTNIITIGSSLLANNNNSYWTSPSGDFAFGFQNINGPAAGYLLSIWFNKIPHKTIVWSANPQTPAPEGSKIELTNHTFQLTNPNGSQIWLAELAGNNLSHAAILDSGNFLILIDSTTLWQSFDHPTDTILPSQTLSQGTRLVARLFDTNFSNGRFQLDMQTDGNLVLYTRRYPMDDVYSAYWSSNSVGSGFQLIYSQTGYIYLTDRNGKVLNLFLSSNNINSTHLYLRTILDYDGVLRQYGYPKSTGQTMNWRVLSFIPSDICTSIIQENGPGACGYNSFCSVGVDRRPKCECPDGYKAFDVNDPLSGCKPDFVKQDCEAEGGESYKFGFVDLVNTDWPLNDYEFYIRVTEDWCREVCLSDCYCDVAIYRDGSCWKKRSPVSNGRANPSVGGKALDHGILA
ncbi:G-type lectin S-receptor-like serine/threonine-protein kinase LECRK3 [Impatiens glandulifera]|uniref:G-type lectin S-receptor-like serine/threonine-protein kinase LECRK3 n=1 Tax=Impatiens glandulifera TaxID=253017 RepID=UPI001FB12614|nr:G-type lectin S-receptor-like serine/threonine-protein kinase LECRK3 [Impatiens glandulifera]